MEINRINSYTDTRFSRKALLQHGCFLVESSPYEVEIFSDFEAVIRGQNKTAYPENIEKFRFYTPHITKFYDEQHQIILEFPPSLDGHSRLYYAVRKGWNRVRAVAVACDEYFAKNMIQSDIGNQ